MQNCSPEQAATIILGKRSPTRVSDQRFHDHTGMGANIALGMVDRILRTGVQSSKLWPKVPDQVPVHLPCRINRHERQNAGVRDRPILLPMHHKHP